MAVPRGAIVVSSLLSLKFLAPQRERFAAVVQARAQRATARFEERKSKEDVDELTRSGQRGLRLSCRLIRVSDWPSILGEQRDAVLVGEGADGHDAEQDQEPHVASVSPGWAPCRGPTAVRSRDDAARSRDAGEQARGVQQLGDAGQLEHRDQVGPGGLSASDHGERARGWQVRPPGRAGPTRWW